jgi:histidinol-phosphate aminotransferase
MSDRLPRPRADLETFPAYRTQQVTADVRVNANEWPEPNPAGLYLSPAELDDILLNRYPSAAATADLRATLAARYGIKPEQLIFGNGSNDVLLNVFLVFGGHGRSTLLFQPTYSMHARLAQIAGGTVVEEDIGLPYDLTLDRALAEVHAKFLERSVLIRDISMWPGCAGCLRTSIGTRAENDRVIAAIDAVFSAAPARA